MYEETKRRCSARRRKDPEIAAAIRAFKARPEYRNRAAQLRRDRRQADPAMRERDARKLRFKRSGLSPELFEVLEMNKQLK